MFLDDLLTGASRSSHNRDLHGLLLKHARMMIVTRGAGALSLV